MGVGLGVRSGRGGLVGWGQGGCEQRIEVFENFFFFFFFFWGGGVGLGGSRLGGGSGWM